MTTQQNEDGDMWRYSPPIATKAMTLIRIKRTTAFGTRPTIHTSSKLTYRAGQGNRQNEKKNASNEFRHRASCGYAAMMTEHATAK
jgi:hypothetical protein